MKIELKLHLSAAERESLLRPVKGVGGFQSLIKKLQKGFSGDVVTITYTRAQAVSIGRVP